MCVHTGGCDPLTTCTNVFGGRTCGACPPLYSGSGLTNCVVENLCATNNGVCFVLCCISLAHSVCSRWLWLAHGVHTDRHIDIVWSLSPQLQRNRSHRLQKHHTHSSCQPLQNKQWYSFVLCVGWFFVVVVLLMCCVCTGGCDRLTSCVWIPPTAVNCSACPQGVFLCVVSLVFVLSWFVAWCVCVCRLHRHRANTLHRHQRVSDSKHLFPRRAVQQPEWHIQLW